MGTDDHQIIVPCLGLYQDLIYHHTPAYLGAADDTRLLKNLHDRFQQLALRCVFGDQFPNAGAQSLAADARAGAHL